MPETAEHGTEIEWTHVPGFKGETWNPTTGCDRVSPGCANCYALELAPRLQRFAAAAAARRRVAAGQQPKPSKWLNVADGGRASGPAFGLTIHPEALDQPLRWRSPRAVFVNSMSDLFHEDVPRDFLAQVFAVMAQCPQHIFMVLTKRADQLDILADVAFIGEVSQHTPADALLPMDWPLPNVWLGVTVENRRFVHRADALRAAPAAVRFISAEPLLGPLVARFEPDGELGEWVWPDGRISDGEDSLDLGGIDWLIAGGESGPRHRPVDPDWIRRLRDEANRMGTAFFFKQWGGRTPKAGGRELDGLTHNEYPATEVVACSSRP